MLDHVVTKQLLLTVISTNHAGMPSLWPWNTMPLFFACTCTTPYPPPHNSPHSPLQPPSLCQVFRGLYALYLEEWAHLWPRDRILFILSEDWFERPRHTLQRITSFLGLQGDVATDDALWQRMQAAEYHRPQNASTRVPLPAARRRVEEFYAARNVRLGQLMGLGARSPWAGRKRWTPTGGGVEGRPQQPATQQQQQQT